MKTFLRNLVCRCVDARTFRGQVRAQDEQNNVNAPDPTAPPSDESNVMPNDNMALRKMATTAFPSKLL